MNDISVFTSTSFLCGVYSLSELSGNSLTLACKFNHRRVISLIYAAHNPFQFTPVMEVAFSEQCWQYSAREWSQSLYGPFIAHLVRGTLPKEVFQEYILQDVYFLKGFLRSFAWMITKTTELQHLSILTNVVNGITNELEMHGSYSKDWGIPKEKVHSVHVHKATKAYLDYLEKVTSSSPDSILPVLAACIPCMKLYSFIGKTITESFQGDDLKSNPFNAWIQQYASSEFEQLSNSLEKLLDDILAREYSKWVSKPSLLKHYRRAMQLELAFFEAYSSSEKVNGFEELIELMNGPFSSVEVSFLFSDAIARSSTSFILNGNETNGGDSSSQAFRTVIVPPNELMPAIYNRMMKDLIVCIEPDMSARNVERKTVFQCLNLSSSFKDEEARRSAQQRPLVLYASNVEELDAFFPSQLERTYTSDPIHENETTVDMLTVYRRPKTSVHKVLIVSGSDSGGGAGMQADIKTCSSLAVFTTSVLTALTAQNTEGVHEIHEVPPSFIKAQMNAVLGDIGTSVVKTGMLPSKESIETLASVLNEYAESHAIQLVVDPVMVSTSGHELISKEAIQSLINVLVPMATITTPNLVEAAHLLGKESIETVEAMKDAVRELHTKCQSKYILLKGGHLKDSSHPDTIYDMLFSGQELMVFTSPRISTECTHGTGCTLASAVASYLAKGCTVEEAVERGREYTFQVIQQSSSLKLGNGKQQPMFHSIE